MASRVALAACWIAGITALTAMLATPRTPQRIVFTGTLLSVVSSGPPGSLGSETQAGVERVAQAVAQEIDGEDGQHDGDAGEEGHPPGVLEKLASLGQHVSPLRCGRADPQAEEAQRRPGDDRRGDPERGEDG